MRPYKRQYVLSLMLTSLFVLNSGATKKTP